MKKCSLIIAFLSIFSVILFAQTKSKTPVMEVMYFRADLPCCQARACYIISLTIEEIIKKNFQKQEIVYKTIDMAEQENKALVSKYNAKSQTLILVNIKKKASIDISKLVVQFARDNDEARFEKELVAKIKEQNH